MLFLVIIGILFLIVGFSIDHTNKETTEKFEKKYGDKVSWRSIILAEESKALGVSEKGVYAWVFNNSSSYNRFTN